jgi:putative endonuclease
MPHFTYIVYSPSFDIYYKGETADIETRLNFHNSNLSRYTKNKGPWLLVYLEEFATRTDALKREKMLKKQNRRYIEWLINQETNKLLRPPCHGPG